MMSDNKSSDISEFEETDKPKALPMSQVPWWIHLLCGWPLVLVAIGGAIGGGLGGAAYGVSVSVYQNTRNLVYTIICSVIAGTAAIGGWYWMAQKIQGAVN